MSPRMSELRREGLSQVHKRRPLHVEVNSTLLTDSQRWIGLGIPEALPLGCEDGIMEIKQAGLTV